MRLWIFHSGRTKTDVVEIKNNEWHFRPAVPPSQGAWQRYRFIKTLLEAKKHNPQRVLEIGAADGFNAACLVEETREVTINDIRPLQDELHYWTTGSQIKFIEGDFFEVDPEQLKQFDLVVACEVIEHVAHGDEFRRHIKRFVKPNGTLLLTTPNGKYCRSKLPTFSQIENFTELETI